MKNITAHTGTLSSIRRLPSSVNGNPRFQLVIDGYTCVTTPDSGLAYAVQIMVGRQVQATIGTYYGIRSLNTIKEV